jgi:hypothetical protein
MERVSQSPGTADGHRARPVRSWSPGRPGNAFSDPATRQFTDLQRAVGNSAVSTWLASLPERPAFPSAPAVSVQRSLISWVVKQGAKKVSKGTLKNFINTQIKGKLKGILDKDMVKRFGKEADDILDALEDPWWATAIGFVPVVGDAFDLARMPVKIRKAFQRADRLEAKVSKVLALQGKKALDVIPGTLKRSPSYASELEHLTYGELRELAATDAKAAAMKKLIENEMRLMDKL